MPLLIYINICMYVVSAIFVGVQVNTRFNVRNTWVGLTPPCGKPPAQAQFVQLYSCIDVSLPPT